MLQNYNNGEYSDGPDFVTEYVENNYENSRSILNHVWVIIYYIANWQFLIISINLTSQLLSYPWDFVLRLLVMH